jgi:hypothetical protein
MFAPSGDEHILGLPPPGFTGGYSNFVFQDNASNKYSRYEKPINCYYEKFSEGG